MAAELSQNPFAVQTPEGIRAEDVLSLFVEDFADFHQIRRVGHTFLNGARGSGKSMIFRFLEPDCQSLKHGKPTSELDFFGFYIPIKETELKLTELVRLEKAHGSQLLNEHLLAVNVVVKVIGALQKVPGADNEPSNALALRSFVLGPMTALLRRGGWQVEVGVPSATATFEEVRKAAERVLDDIYAVTARYLQQLSFGGDLKYTGPLFGYLDFVRPFVIALRNARFMPKAPIFLLIDDADNLNLEQTKILNTWVSSRGSADVSLKISTQRRYKTYRTVTGQFIETPHDFAEVEISDIYTSEKDRYLNRIRSIVAKRLQRAGLTATPEAFFPEDADQETRIREIAASIKSSWSESGRGYRANDDAYRHARPDFIKSLQGTSKSGATYSYAGFGQLVHLSSGVVRFFLEPAALMYGAQQAENAERVVNSIRPHIQDNVVRDEGYKFLIAEFERISRDEEIDQVVRDRATRLRNLIDSLGALFHAILVSEASERRVFSVAFSNGPDDEVREVFDLGVEYGYFHKSTIGKKEGPGRTSLYILSRRLAPVFTLDPTSFAGYKFITNDVARTMILNPKRFINQLRSKALDDVIDSAQGRLF